MMSVSHLTYTEVLVTIFANQAGLPVPSVVLLMAAGALCARGDMQAAILLPLSVVACVAADGVWYWLGRRWGLRPLQILCGLSPDPRKALVDAQRKFEQYGLRLLFVSKFLPGVDAVMPPLAGANGVSTLRFLAFDAPGSFLWSGFYLAVGYVFRSQLEVIVAWVGQFGAAFGVIVGVSLGIFLGGRALSLVRMILRLRRRRITPPMLARKLISNGRIAVLDLLQFEHESPADFAEVIPGAFALDPSRLPNTPQLRLPDDVEVILYCSSGSDAVAARAAVALEKAGVNNVWVLEGGLKAWREHQLPLASTPDLPENVAARLGVRLPE